jgi:hypothetical protein
MRRRKNSLTDKTKGIISKYKNGMSCSEIAIEYGLKKNSVVSLLRKHGVCKKAMGRDIEELVFDYLKHKDVEVQHMRGDEKYDLLVDDSVKIDVKSSSLSKDNFYRFSLYTSKGGKIKDLYKNIDYFYLIAKDDPLLTIYSLPVSKVSRYQVSLAVSLNKLSSCEVVGYLNTKEVKKNDKH